MRLYVLIYRARVQSHHWKTVVRELPAEVKHGLYGVYINIGQKKACNTGINSAVYHIRAVVVKLLGIQMRVCIGNYH